MDGLSFTHLDHESIVLFNDRDATIESHARAVITPAAYRAVSLLDGLSAYAAVFDCSAGSGAGNA